jgi:AcrR family transcriptional regulator
MRAEPTAAEALEGIPEARSQFEEAIGNLPPTAARLCRAARDLLVRDGFPALTVEAITQAAGENKASVRYYFGNKAGLLAALVDSLTPRGEIASMIAHTDPLPPGRERLKAHIDGLRGLMDDMDSFRAQYYLLPHILIDEELRPQIAALYEWHRQLNVRMLGIQVPTERERMLRSVGALLTAAVDGFAMQALLDPEGFQLDEAFDALEELVGRYLASETPSAAER